MENFREEMRYEYPLTPDSVVIDLGCYEGTFAARIHEKYGCRVFAFEPVAHFFERCYKRFEGVTDKIRVIPFAVGGESGVVNGSVKGDMSGLYADGESKWSCIMMTMDEALDKVVGESYADLLKINIEGSEFSLLEDMAKKDLIKFFGNIQCQWHDVVPNAQARYDALQKELAKTHHLTFDHGWVWQNWEINK